MAEMLKTQPRDNPWANMKIKVGPKVEKPKYGILPILQKSPAEKDMAKVDIQPASLFNKMNVERMPRRVPLRNFPENELQLNKHYAAVSQAGPNPSDAFR